MDEYQLYILFVCCCCCCFEGLFLLFYFCNTKMEEKEVTKYFILKMHSVYFLIYYYMTLDILTLD